MNMSVIKIQEEKINEHGLYTVFKKLLIPLQCKRCCARREQQHHTLHTDPN